jgi:hypothetical protein
MVMPSGRTPPLFTRLIAGFADGLQNTDVKVPIWVPNVGPQTVAYESAVDEIFYGGQAGGGKTDLSLGLAITQHRRSIIFRRNFNQLTGADGIIQRSKDILGDVKGAKFVGSPTPLWRELPGDRMLEFGAVDREDDVSKYKGRPHDLKVFDEVSEFTEYQYLFLAGWLRTRFPGQRLRIIATGNPPTSPEGYWVLRRWGAWLDPTHPMFPTLPGTALWYARLDGKDTLVESGEPFAFESNTGKTELIIPRSRTFIRASLSDNPYITPEYVAQLQALPEPLRSQLLYGDFMATPDDDDWQIIPTKFVRAAQERWRAWEAAGKPRHHLTSLGVDVGSGQPGRDRTIFAPIYDLIYVDTLERPIAQDVNTATMEFAGMVADILHNNRGAQAIIDGIGYGLGMLQVLYMQHEPVRGFIASAGTYLTERSGQRGFLNARAAVWWLVREMLDPEGGYPICLPPDPLLLADLTAPRYRYTPSGLIQLEEKDSIKRRIHRSTDYGDAVVMGLAGATVLDNLGKEETYTEVTYNPPKIGNY